MSVCMMVASNCGKSCPILTKTRPRSRHLFYSTVYTCWDIIAIYAGTFEGPSHAPPKRRFLSRGLSAIKVV